LTGERSLSEYFEAAVKSFGGGEKSISNWMINDLTRLMNDLDKTAAELILTPAFLAEIIRLVEEGKINAATGKNLLRKVEESGRDPVEIVEAEGLAVIADRGALRTQIEAILAGAPDEVTNFKAGKESLLGWFVGQVMRATGGKADPKLTREILLELLKN
jgi:aspartyl-tRNA(Asn)/glutamyl-tRNA(Gln) amidotransferase subunit B